jgi:ABC-2 type transport system permease protein
VTPWRTIRLIAARDFVERAGSRAFQISTAFTMLLVLAAAIVPALFADDAPPPLLIASVGEPPTLLAAQVGAALDDGRAVEVLPVSDIATAEAAVAGGDFDIAIVVGSEIIVRDGPTATSAVVAAVAGALEIGRRAGELGIEPAVLGDILGAASYDLRSLAPETDEDDSNRAFAFIGSILMFISIVTYGQWILIGVIEEKTNRVVEVVLGTVRPHHLLSGKIAGIGMLGLLQLLATVGLGLGAVRFAGTFDLPPATGGVVVNVLFWFVLGFAFYATAYAAAGSLVSRQEEAQNVAFPLTIMLTGAYLVASFSIQGDNPVLRVASLLPPLAPITMPLRIAGGDASLIDITISIALMIGSVYLLVRAAGRIYRGGLLRTGRKVGVRDAWKSAEV